MPSFVRRRADALIAEAELLLAEGTVEGAIQRLIAACNLLRRCPGPPVELPALLRRLGDLSASIGNEELSDRSYLDAWNLDQQHAFQEQRLFAAAGLPPGSILNRLNTQQWSPSLRNRVSTLRQGLIAPLCHLVVHGGGKGSAGKLVAALGSEWVTRGISVLYRTGRTLVEELLLAHRQLNTDVVLRSFDTYQTVIINEPDLPDLASARCFELFLEDRATRASVAIACTQITKKTLAGATGKSKIKQSNEWIHLLRSGGDTLLLDLS